jgi:hypothetical protein
VLDQGRGLSVCTVEETERTGRQARPQDRHEEEGHECGAAIIS